MQTKYRLPRANCCEGEGVRERETLAIASRLERETLEVREDCESLSKAA